MLILTPTVAPHSLTAVSSAGDLNKAMEGSSKSVDQILRMHLSTDDKRSDRERLDTLMLQLRHVIAKQRQEGGKQASIPHDAQHSLLLTNNPNRTGRSADSLLIGRENDERGTHDVMQECEGQVRVSA